MKLEPGTKMYRYIVGVSGVCITEGLIKQYPWHDNDTECVFVDNGGLLHCVHKCDIGRVLFDRDMDTLWLTDRDDELAKRILVTYQKKRIAKLKECLKKRQAFL